MKLLVRNLDRSTTEKEVSDLFKAFGKVQSCDLVRDKKNKMSKGFGFVEMPKAADAQVAIKELNNKTVGQNQIRVKRATEPHS